MFAQIIKHDCPLSELQDPKLLQYNEQLGAKVKKIVIPGYETAYNPSIVKNRSGYTLFFRYDYDFPHYMKEVFFYYMTYVGMVDLDENFTPISQPQFLGLTTPYAEDPRVIFFEDSWYVFYNTIDNNFPKHRKMCVAVVEPSSKRVLYESALPENKNKVEKNWTPFIGVVDGRECIQLIYSFEDMVIYRLFFEDAEVQMELMQTDVSQNAKMSRWMRSWGEIRGGSPAILADGKYWAFFHSNIKKKIPELGVLRSCIFYQMGCLTFDPDTKELQTISRYPLVFNGAYETSRERCRNKWIEYPAGCIYDAKTNSFIVSVGENDAGMYIVQYPLDILENQLEELNSSL
jgi:hypothetical protein